MAHVWASFFYLLDQFCHLILILHDRTSKCVFELLLHLLFPPNTLCSIIFVPNLKQTNKRREKTTATTSTVVVGPKVCSDWWKNHVILVSWRNIAIAFGYMKHYVHFQENTNFEIKCSNQVLPLCSRTGIIHGCISLSVCVCVCFFVVNFSRK